jgi:hypothetical protein
MDALAFDNLLKSNGLQLVHYRAMRCPGGLVDIDDIRRPHQDHAGCSNGFLYKRQGTITTLMTSNSTDPRFQDIGILNGSTIQVTFPRFYDDPQETRIYVLPFDRFFLTDSSILTAEWQLVRAHETGSDRTRFPVAKVQNIIDSTLAEYGPETYDIVGGQIVWRSNQGPPPGIVYTIWYEYQPYWYVAMLHHEIRVVGTRDYITGEAKVSRMPFSAMLTRENVFRNEENDPQAPQSIRQQAGPAVDGFGSR